jgi:glutaminyl-peptide cyclotransferase
MHRAKTLIALLALTIPAGAAGFDGAAALECTRQLVAFGPRPSGSPALKQSREFIEKKLRAAGWQVAEDSFAASTPVGSVAMVNIVARKPGSSGKAVAITGHYDTKRFPFPFVGANDGGSSAGLLLGMANAVGPMKLKNDVYLVFFDGEEAVRDWTAKDSLYGSRHLSDKWAADGTLERIVALINVDMTGDRDLNIVAEQFSSASLRSLVWEVAARLGYAKYFSGAEIPIEDDHVPFLRKGVRALDLIDFSYGPNHSWWHTSQDTMDKLSANSFTVVGSVLVGTVEKLEP